MAGGLVARRLSGGGAVYQDEGSLNATIILPKSELDIPVKFVGVGEQIDDMKEFDAAEFVTALFE